MKGSSAFDEYLSWNDSENRFDLTSSLALNADGPDGFTALYFYNSDNITDTSRLAWDHNSDRFMLTDGLRVVEDLEVSTHTDPAVMNVIIDSDDDQDTASWDLHHDGDHFSTGKLAELEEDGDLRITGSYSCGVSFDLAEAFLARGTVPAPWPEISRSTSSGGATRSPSG